MAEIKVEPTRGGFGWLWVIILLVVIAAGVWYFMANSRPVPTTAPQADSARTSRIDSPSTVAWRL